MNGTFTIPSDVDFNAGDSANVSRAADDPGRPPARLLHEGPLHRDVRPGQVAAGRAPHRERGLALRPGTAADAEPVEPALHRSRRATRPTRTTSRRASGSPTRWTPVALGRARRLRGLLSADVYTFLTPMFSAGRYSDSFTAMFPTNNADPGPRAGTIPANPFLANGPFVNHDAIDALFPPGTLNRNVGTVRFDRPDRRERLVAAVQHRLRAADWRDARRVSVDFIRSEQRDQYVLMDLESRHSRHHARHQHARAASYPIVGEVGEFIGRVDTPVNVGEIDYNSVQVGDDQAAVRRIQWAAVVRVLARSGQRGHRPGRPRPLSVPRRPQPGSQIRADQRGSAARPDGGGVVRGAADEGAESERRLPRAIRHALLADGHDQRRRPQRADQRTNTCRRAPTAASVRTPSAWTTRAGATARAGRPTPRSTCEWAISSASRVTGRSTPSWTSSTPPTNPTSPILINFNTNTANASDQRLTRHVPEADEPGQRRHADVPAEPAIWILTGRAKASPAGSGTRAPAVRAVMKRTFGQKHHEQGARSRR